MFRVTFSQPPRRAQLASSMHEYPFLAFHAKTFSNEVLIIISATGAWLMIVAYLKNTLANHKSLPRPTRMKITCNGSNQMIFQALL
jgi:hypothetical protein